MTRSLCLVALLCWLPAAADESEQYPSLSVGGLLFGDLYYLPSNHIAEDDGDLGLVLRRGYLTFNADLGRQTFGRLRFELNQSGEFETYTFSTVVKDLFLGWNLGRQRLIAGLTSTPTFDLIESVWGFRYLARTPMDLQGIPSRDTGLYLSGPLNRSGSFSYRAMLGTGINFAADRSNSAKWMGAVTWKPAPGWTVDLYADFEDQRGTGERSTLQAFVAYQTENLRWGLQYSNQNRREDPPLKLASAFLIKNLGESYRLVGRVDRLLAPSPRGNGISYLPMDPTAKATEIFSGIEFLLRPHWSLTPNTVVTVYDHNDQGVRPRMDVHLRLTLFVNFE